MRLSPFRRPVSSPSTRRLASPEPGAPSGGTPDSADHAGRRLRVPFDVSPDDPRVSALASQLVERFRPYCDGMPPDAFERLVRHAARIRLRWPS